MNQECQNCRFSQPATEEDRQNERAFFSGIGESTPESDIGTMMKDLGNMIFPLLSSWELIRCTHPLRGDKSLGAIRPADGFCDIVVRHGYLDMERRPGFEPKSEFDSTDEASPTV